MRTYRPFDHPDLARRFAGLPLGREAVLEFTNQWGLLDNHAIARFDGISARRRRIAALFLMLDLPVPAGSLISGAELAAISFSEPGVPLYLRLAASAVPPRLFFAPQSLYGAILVQVAFEISGVKTIAGCLNCGAPLVIGRGSRTKRAKFCSDPCRAAWHRRQPEEK